MVARYLSKSGGDELMQLWLQDAIFTDAEGAPIPRPEKPPKGSSFDEMTAWLRAVDEYEDKIRDIANRAFSEQFAKALK